MSVASQSLITLAHGSRSFRLASRFLPAATQADAAIVYAFCRYVDDVVDEAPDRVTAATAVARIRDELLGYAEPSELIAVFLEVVERTGMLRDAAVALVDGVASDLGEVRISNDRALLRYCYGVASTVGLMMCGVLGVRDRAAYPFAIDLGVAMQITNICRDVAADAELDRTYLPASRLADAGTSADALLGRRAGPAEVATVVGDLLRMADTYYQSAFDGMRYIPFRTRTAIVVAALLYRQIGVKLRRNGCNALAGRTVVGPLEKAVTVMRALVFCLSPRILGLRPLPGHRNELHRPLAGLPGAAA